MESFNEDSSSAASAPAQRPPQPVAISSTLPNASPDGSTPGGLDSELQSSENETNSPFKDGVKIIRKNRLSAESLTCPSCGKVCSNKSKFLRHLSTHSEERPYSCPLCKKGFKWVEYLSKHMKQQHPNSVLTPIDVTTASSNSQAVTSQASEENVVGINLEDGDSSDTPPLLQGRLTIPNPLSLIPSLDNGTGGAANHSTPERVVQSSSCDNTQAVNNAIEVKQAASQECSGRFQDLYQSPVVIVCSTNADTNTTESIPATAVANGPNDPIAMATSEEPTAFTITSSFESSHHNTVTFAVPVLSQGISVASTSIVTSYINQLYTKTSNMDHTSMTNGSFDATYSNNSFDQSGGFSSDNALIVPEGTINCQLASSLTNSEVQMDTATSHSGGDNEVTHSGSPVMRKYICEHEGCTKTYRYKKDVIRHMKMKHGSQPIRYEQKEVPELLQRRHGCSQCEKMYAHRKDLLRHQRDVHSPEAIARREASKSNQKKYPCLLPNCNKLYVHKKDLIRHRRNDHNDLTDTKDMHIPEPISPSQFSPSPAKRQRSNNWPSGGGKIVSAKPETAVEPIAASDWLGVTVVKEGNVTAAVMATTDGNTGTLASNCALFNTSPSPSSTNAASSLLSLLNSASQQTLPVDTAAAAQLMGQAASVHPLFSAVTSNTQGATPPESTPQ